MPYIVSGAWTVDKSTAENSPRNCSVYSQVRTSRLAFLFFIFGWSPNLQVVLFSAVTVPTLNISAQYNVTGFSLCRFRLNAEYKQKTKKKKTISPTRELLSEVERRLAGSNFIGAIEPKSTDLSGCSMEIPFLQAASGSCEAFRFYLCGLTKHWTHSANRGSSHPGRRHLAGWQARGLVHSVHSVSLL